MLKRELENSSRKQGTQSDNWHSYSLKKVQQGKKKKGDEVAEDEDDDDDAVRTKCVTRLSDSDTMY